ncbi:hypothetical protein BH09MYX1_BH09MYX1_31740 [soil metagenome]
MRIAIVGGVERAEQHYDRVAKEHGHEVDFHPGHIGGRGTYALAQAVDKADVVIIVTDVNSHGAVRFARQRLRLRGRSPILLRGIGVSRFEALLIELNEPAAVGTVAQARR